MIYDRTGKIELARFEREKRRVVSYDQVPQLILDATTTAEDRTFWTNDGYDPTAIVAAAFQNASGDGSGERGASTSNRNFDGRQGAGGRTHLVSPAMAAAAAIEGHFVDIRKLG